MIPPQYLDAMEGIVNRPAPPNPAPDGGPARIPSNPLPSHIERNSSNPQKRGPMSWWLNWTANLSRLIW